MNDLPSNNLETVVYHRGKEYRGPDALQRAALDDAMGTDSSEATPGHWFKVEFAGYRADGTYPGENEAPATNDQALELRTKLAEAFGFSHIDNVSVQRTD